MTTITALASIASFEFVKSTARPKRPQPGCQAELSERVDRWACHIVYSSSAACFVPAARTRLRKPAAIPTGTIRTISHGVV